MGSFYVLVNHHFGHEKTILNIHDHEQAFSVLPWLYSCIVNGSYGECNLVPRDFLLMVNGVCKLKQVSPI